MLVLFFFFCSLSHLPYCTVYKVLLGFSIRVFYSVLYSIFYVTPTLIDSLNMVKDEGTANS